MLRLTKDARFGKDSAQAQLAWTQVFTELYKETTSPLRGFPGYKSQNPKQNVDSFKDWIARVLEENDKLEHAARFAELLEEARLWKTEKDGKELIKTARANVTLDKAAKQAAYQASEALLGLRPQAVVPIAPLAAPHVVGETFDLSTVDENDYAVGENSNSSLSSLLQDKTNLLQRAPESARTATRKRPGGASIGAGKMSGPRGANDPINQIDAATSSLTSLLENVSSAIGKKSRGGDLNDHILQGVSTEQKKEYDKLLLARNFFGQLDPAMVDPESIQLFKDKQNDFMKNLFSDKKE
jgi:hypothetical protein